MIIHLESTEAGFERMKDLFESGQLTEISGRRILSVRRSEAGSGGVASESNKKSSARVRSVGGTSKRAGVIVSHVAEAGGRRILRARKSETDSQTTYGKAARGSRKGASGQGEVYLKEELYPFDEAYMTLLRRGDRATQDHFAEYFGRLLRVKLRGRKLLANVIKDVQQETVLRVLIAVRTGEVRQPEQLGPFVNCVCNNILLEYAREQVVDFEAAEESDERADLEARVIPDERAQRVHKIVINDLGLGKKETEALQSVLGGDDKDDVCNRLGVDRVYLRALIHRALKIFMDRYKAEKPERK
jgi:RNA polymerase sigma-70 factor (ECF subfamily)